MGLAPLPGDRCSLGRMQTLAGERRLPRESPQVGDGKGERGFS